MNTISNRINTYSAFTGISIEDIMKSIRYARYVDKSNIRIGCECGCGGDNISVKLYAAGQKAIESIFSPR